MIVDPRRKAQLKANKEAARQRARNYVANYFATHFCADCGASDSVVLTFDHVRGTKKGNISDMVNNGWSLETIIAEIKLRPFDSFLTCLGRKVVHMNKNYRAVLDSAPALHISVRYA